jgi:hypothetical protein
MIIDDIRRAVGESSRIENEQGEPYSKTLVIQHLGLRRELLRVTSHDNRVFVLTTTYDNLEFESENGHLQIRAFHEPMLLSQKVGFIVGECLRRARTSRTSWIFSRRDITLISGFFPIGTPLEDVPPPSIS